MENKKLTKEELDILWEMPDHRFVEEPLHTAFLCGGLSAFRRFVIDYNKDKSENERLAILLRGNSNKIIIYKNNHKLWELTALKKTVKVSFDFNHARFTEDWKKKLKRLRQLGFKYVQDSKKERVTNCPALVIKRSKKDNHIESVGVGEISCSKKEFTDDFVKEVFSIFSELISDFFTLTERTSIDRFREEYKKESGIDALYSVDRKIYAEKMWQQRLFFVLKDNKDGYYAYDLEFSQPFPSKRFVEKYAKEYGKQYLSVNANNLKKKLTTNEPDILAIRYKNKIPSALVIIEVKSTANACKNPSGIEDHLKGMYKYSGYDYFMTKRKADAFKSIQQFIEFEIEQGNVVLPDNIEKLPVERILLLTNDKVVEDSQTNMGDGGAVRYFAEEAQQQTIELAKMYECEIWTTNSLYSDEEIKFNKVDIE